jgi:hypothetical protein
LPAAEGSNQKKDALPAAQTFKFTDGFPIYEQPLGDEFVPKGGKQWKMEDLEPPGG